MGLLETSSTVGSRGPGPWQGAAFHSSPAVASLKRINCSEKMANNRKGAFCEQQNRVKRDQVSPVSSQLLQKSMPLAASIAILLWSNPVDAGILSGIKGLESMPGPELPKLEFLERMSEENQKKYAEFDSRFKSSPILKELLERSKLNKERNQQEIQDKYCIRGAEWGVGDCSTQGMTEEEKDTFISTLKQKSSGR